jgi:hypothetical protein
MDLASRADGIWLVVGLGDGRVPGLQDPASAGRFYAMLSELATGAGTTVVAALRVPSSALR